MKKRILSILLTFIMLLGAFAVIPVNAETVAVAETEFGWNGHTAKAPEGDGTFENPYKISSPENLRWMQTFVVGGAQHFQTFGYDHELWIPTYSEGDNLESESPKTVDYESFKDAPQVYFEQTCDIDLNGKTLYAISSYIVAEGAENGTKTAKGQWFGGYYNGNGHSIKNGYISGGGKDNDNWNGGLFGTVWGATIENMVFDNVHATSHETTAMLVGKVLGAADFDKLGGHEDIFNARKTVIRNITVKDNCSITQTGANNETGLFAGGIVAMANANTTITNCINEADITVDANVLGVGGIVGLMHSNIVVDHCINKGDIYYTGSWTTTVNNEVTTSKALRQQCTFGGIVGSWGKDTSINGNSAITNCINEGSFASDVISKEASAGSSMLSYGGILGRAFGLVANDGATYTFNNNINAGADPSANISANVNGKAANRVAALIGSAWNNTTYDWVQLVATNCYSAPFTGIAGYPLLPSTSNPLVCSTSKTMLNDTTSRPCATADETCKTLDSVNKVYGLDLYVQINYEINGFEHNLLFVQTKPGENGTYSVRMINGVNSLDFKRLNYDVMLTVDGKQGLKTYSQSTVYTSFIEENNGVQIEHKASDYGYEYLSIITFNGLANGTTYTFGFTPKVVYSDKTVGEGDATVITVKDGNATYCKPDDVILGDIKINGADIDEFKIVYVENNEPTYYVADALRKYILQATGKELELIPNAQNADFEIRVGYSEVGNSVERGSYSVIQTGYDLELLFSGALAAEELVVQMRKLYMNNREYNVNLRAADGTLYVEENHPLKGDTAVSTGAKAVLEKDDAGDIRILYHNIHCYTIVKEAQEKGYEGTVDELYEKLVKTYAESLISYDPDIICLQEADNRAKVVLDMLKGKGYDCYRGLQGDVDNGSITEGYGYPIFWKSDKFRLVDSGTPWKDIWGNTFLNQLDNIVVGKGYGSNWVILEEIGTGKQFAVFSSHFTANSVADNDAAKGAYWRDYLAKQLTDEVSRIMSSEYGIDTVITGGDYNHRMNDPAEYNGTSYAPYERLLEGGLTNVRDVIDATDVEYLAMRRAHQYDNEKGMYTLNSAGCTVVDNSIDHILYRTNGDTIDLKRYKVCDDAFTCTLSDHAAHFVDFGWK